MVTKSLIVLSFIACDIVTGVVAALSSGTYDSSKMRTGLWHKLSEIIAVMFCYLCDWALPQFDIQIPVQLFSAVTVYLVVMESGSIIENLGLMFPELGEHLKDVFSKVDPNGKR